MSAPTDTGSILEWMLRYRVDRGWYGVPSPQGGKGPVLPEWEKLRLEPEDMAKHWPNGHTNGGLILGPSGLADVDLDCPEALLAGGVLLPLTGLVSGRLSNPRSHWWYCAADPSTQFTFAKYIDPIRFADKALRKDATLVELRSGDNQTLVPPSVHPSGERYEWHRFDEPVAIDPRALTEHVGKVAAASLLARYWPEGARDTSAMALSGGLLRAGWAQDDVRAFMRAVTAAAHDEETESRIRTVADTARKLAAGQLVTGWRTLAGILGDRIVDKVREWLDIRTAWHDEVAVIESASGDERCTDLGNSERLIRLAGGKILYVQGLGWLTWQGTHWARDEAGVVERAKSTARSIYHEAAEAPDKSRRDELAKHAARSEAAPRIMAMVQLAETAAAVRREIGELDRNPNLLNCLSGTLDLSTGELREHTPEDLITRVAPVRYDAFAECPAFEQFLLDVFDGDRELIDFVQRAVGYSATAHTRERALFFCHGAGRNGKSTLLAVCRDALGEYALHADFSSFVTSKYPQANPIRSDLVRMRGARFVTSIEASEGMRFDEATLKQLAGGSDEITARTLHQEPITFRPTGKLWLAANHKPEVRDTTNSIWDRIHLIPFTVRFGDLQTDPQATRAEVHGMDIRLKSELPGILRWIVDGALAYMRAGLRPPEIVRAATAAYRAEQDVTGQFLDERCELHPRLAGLTRDAALQSEWYTTAAGLYHAYTTWCEQSGEKPLTQRWFGPKLEEKGLIAARDTTKNRVWLGVKITKDA